MNHRPYLYGMEKKNKNLEVFNVNQLVMAGIKVGSAIKYMPAQIKEISLTTCTVHVLGVGSYIVSKKYIY
jgi:hypothetical protein